MRRRTHLPARAGAAHGFTMIELMIAMTISLLLTVALVTLLSNNSRATGDLDRASRQIENGRYALDTLTQQIQMAGYWGELATSGAQYSTPDPCNPALAALGFATSPLTVPVALQGHQGTGADPAPACVTNAAPNTAALVIRRLSSTTTALAALAANTPYLQTSRCASDPVTLPFVLDEAAPAFVLRDFACAAPLPARAYQSPIFFVATCSNCGQDTIPTLKRLDFVNGAATLTPIAEGIEELQVEYGFDTNGDGVPDLYLQAPDGVAGSPSNDWSNVMAVRLWVVSRSTEPTPGYTDTKTYDLGAFGVRGPYNDGFKRRVYSTVVRITNPAGWRE